MISIAPRNSSRIAFLNFIIKFLLTRKKIKKKALRSFVNMHMFEEVIRPVPFSTYSNKKITAGSRKEHYDPEKWKVDDYTSWNSLTDRSYSNRLLGCASSEYMEKLPKVEEVVKLFMRGERAMSLSTKTSVMFMGFAQWFTDGFFISDFKDLRKTKSTHQLDLCQIYGTESTTTNILRSGEGGLLKTQLKHVKVDGKLIEKEFPPYLFEEDKQGNLRIAKEFEGLPYLEDLENFYKHQWNSSDGKERKRKMYATGIFKGNMTVSHSALNCIFLRFHNKIAKLLAAKNSSWDDDRIFETTRNITIVVFLGVIVEDYVNHLNPTTLNLSLDPGFAEKEPWYRENWISVEFNLMYRWHNMIPDNIDLGRKQLDTFKDFHLNNTIVEKHGVAQIFEDLSFQRSGEITTLYNVPNFMRHVEMITLNTARALKIRSYNDYRKAFDLEPLKSFEELTSNGSHARELEKIYGSIDNVEFYVGLFADDKDRGKAKRKTIKRLFSDGTKPLLGELMLRMVGYEAFSQILTNPLLAKNIYNEKTFTKEGFQLIQEIRTFSDLVYWTEERQYNITFQSIQIQ